MSLFEFTSFVLGLQGELVPAMSYPDQDCVAFEVFKKEFEEHIPTIEYVGLDFYNEDEGKSILRHCAKIADYMGIWF